MNECPSLALLDALHIPATLNTPDSTQLSGLHPPPPLHFWVLCNKLTLHLVNELIITMTSIKCYLRPVLSEEL